MQINPREKAKHISKCLELAILLEASADKPGNVNRTAGFENTRYEHFLASAVAITSFFECAALRGVLVSRGEIRVGDIKIGRIIKGGVANVSAWQRGGNTLLGTAILLSPIAVAAGMTPVKQDVFRISKIRENVKLVVESTTPEDAINVYEAIKKANPGGLSRVSELDINDPDSINRIRKEKNSLYQIFKIASKRDTICSEWVNNYPMTFDVAYPFLMGQIRQTDDLNAAIVHTFLKVLAECPDTLIARKTSLEKALEFSFKAEEILKLGGLETSNGRESLSEFDRALRKAGNLLNPGTTADIIAASLALIILNGYRP
ncbi:triphosphoribosyl-dephospho-CoA synthase [Candidatus Bathyarchaeota archaeon]|nr:triphosphoribosyl-dephospho-CoA synthase [Candidatus Bathyarchaeota archaeon]